MDSFRKYIYNFADVNRYFEDIKNPKSLYYIITYKLGVGWQILVVNATLENLL